MVQVTANEDGWDVTTTEAEPPPEQPKLVLHAGQDNRVMHVINLTPNPYKTWDALCGGRVYADRVGGQPDRVCRTCIRLAKEQGLTFSSGILLQSARLRLDRAVRELDRAHKELKRLERLERLESVEPVEPVTDEKLDS